MHGTKPTIDLESDKEVPKVIGVSLVIFDTESKKSGHIELPKDVAEQLLYASDVFVSEAGIHFPVKEIKSENEKAYRVFQVTEVGSN